MATQTISRQAHYGGPGTTLQIQHTLISTRGSRSIPDSSVDYQIDAADEFKLTIIPKGDNSHFKIYMRWFGEVATAWNHVFNVTRDGVRLNAVANRYTGLIPLAQSYTSDNNSSTPESAQFTTLDTTGSTTGVPITFKMVISTTTAVTLYTNRCVAQLGQDGYENGVSEIIVTEIAG